MTDDEYKAISDFKARFLTIHNQLLHPARAIEKLDALDRDVAAERAAVKEKIQNKADFRGELIATFGVAAGVGATLLGMPTIPAVIGTLASFFYAEKKRTAYAFEQKVEHLDYTTELATLHGRIEATEDNLIRDNLDAVLRDEQVFKKLPRLRDKWMETYKQQTPPAASSANGLKKGM